MRDFVLINGKCLCVWEYNKLDFFLFLPISIIYRFNEHLENAFKNRNSNEKAITPINSWNQTLFSIYLIRITYYWRGHYLLKNGSKNVYTLILNLFFSYHNTNESTCIWNPWNAKYHVEFMLNSQIFKAIYFDVKYHLCFGGNKTLLNEGLCSWHDWQIRVR